MPCTNYFSKAKERKTDFNLTTDNFEHVITLLPVEGKPWKNLTDLPPMEGCMQKEARKQEDCYKFCLWSQLSYKKMDLL